MKFWTDKAGFVLRRSHLMGPDTKWLEVGPQGAESCLVIYPKSNDGMMKDLAERKPSVVFECQDLQEKYQEMSSREVTFTEPPKQMPWGQFAIFLDTEGNWFGLRQKVE